MTDPPSNRQVSVSASSSASVSTSSHPQARSETRTTGVPVEYKVVDHPWSPMEPDNTETALTEIGQDGWRLIAIYPDPQREKTRWIFSR